MRNIYEKKPVLPAFFMPDYLKMVKTIPNYS